MWLYHCFGCMQRRKFKQPLKTKQIALGETTSNAYQDHRIPSHRRLSFSVLAFFFLGCCWICFLWINGLSGISISTISLTLFVAFKVSFPQRRHVGQILATEMNLVTKKFTVFSNKLTRFGFIRGLFKEKRPVKNIPLILMLHVFSSYSV